MLTLVLVSLPLPMPEACDWWNRWWGTPATTYYVPYTANYVPAQVVNYVPQTAYRTVYVNTPVVSYTPVAGCNACGQPTTVMRPVTSFVTQPRLVPYTTYRPVVTAVAPACNTCAAYRPIVAPVAAVAPACNTCARRSRWLRPFRSLPSGACSVRGRLRAAPAMTGTPVQAGMPVQPPPGGTVYAPGTPGSVVQSLAPTPAMPPAGDRPLGPMINPQGPPPAQGGPGLQGPPPAQNQPLDTPPSGAEPAVELGWPEQNVRRTADAPPDSNSTDPSLPGVPSEKPSEPQSRILLPPYANPSNSNVPPRNYAPESQDRTTALPIRPFTTAKNVSTSSAPAAANASSNRVSDSGWYASSR